MDMRRRQPIGVELVKRGIVTENDIEEALKYQREHPNKKLGDILYILDVCEPNKLIESIGEILGTKGIISKNSFILSMAICRHKLSTRLFQMPSTSMRG